MAERTKYQIFVSSTYDDLKDQREQAVKAILEIGHIPIGMEMFNASDETQWSMIKRYIDESDYYVVVVAHRYGSEKDGISYTEMEYDYALSRGVPTIGFVIKEDADWPAHFVDKETRKQHALAKFKSKVTSKTVRFWSNSSDLGMAIGISLPKVFVTNPRPGWVKAENLPSPLVSEELARLSVENLDLRERLSRLGEVDDVHNILSHQIKLKGVVTNQTLKKEVEVEVTISLASLLLEVSMAIVRMNHEAIVESWITSELMKMIVEYCLFNKFENDVLTGSGSNFSFIYNEFVRLKTVLYSYGVCTYREGYVHDHYILFWQLDDKCRSLIRNNKIVQSAVESVKIIKAGPLTRM